MRSETSRPSSLRTFCRKRTTSRAVPSSASSSVTRVSIATTSEPSVCASKPSRACERSSYSPGVELLARDLHDAVGAELVVARRERRAHLLHLRAETRAERAEVRHDLLLDEALEVGRRGHGLDVELARDLAAERRERLEAAGVAAGHDRGRERLAHAQLGLGARAVPELADRAHVGHRRRAGRPRCAPRRPRDSRPGAPRRARPAPQPRATRLSHISSVRNGVTGPMIRRHCTSAWCSVANAARSPSQKRWRERRTYQFERSSQNASTARVMLGVS